MKTAIIFILGLLPALVLGQTDTHVVAFALDTFGIDSFFLVARDTAYTATDKRPFSCATSTFFSDTAAFSAHIATVYTEYDALVAQAQALARRKAEWDYRYQRLVCLRDSVFYGASCSGIGARLAIAPTQPDGLTIGGFWVVYPVTSAAQYVHSMDDVTADAILLYENGVQAKYRKSKAVKKPRQKKKK